MQHAISRENFNLKRSLCLILSVIPCLLSCSLFVSQIDSVTDFLPRDTDLSGWNRISPPAEYSGLGIRRYNINYYKTGIKRFSVCRYESLNETDPVITVEVARFDSVLNAYGFFSRICGERSFTADSVNELLTDNFAVALRGEYVIHIFTAPETAGSSVTFKNFIRISLKYIGINHSKDKLPEQINILKNNGKYGIIYSVKSLENLSDIDRIYLTRWVLNRNTVTVFASERQSFSDSYELFRKRINSGFILSESGGVYTAFKRKSDRSYTFISVYKNWIYGAQSVTDIDTGKKITDELKSRILPYSTE